MLMREFINVVIFIAQISADELIIYDNYVLYMCSTYIVVSKLAP